MKKFALTILLSLASFSAFALDETSARYCETVDMVAAAIKKNGNTIGNTPENAYKTMRAYYAQQAGKDSIVVSHIDGAWDFLKESMSSGNKETPRALCIEAMEEIDSINAYAGESQEK